jgi:hypothetical protein
LWGESFSFYAQRVAIERHVVEDETARAVSHTLDLFAGDGVGQPYNGVRHNRARRVGNRAFNRADLNLCAHAGRRQQQHGERKKSGYH